MKGKIQKMRMITNRFGKTVIALAAAASMLTACTGAGANTGANKPAVDKEKTSESTETDGLPKYEYKGEEEYLPAICDDLVKSVENKDVEVVIPSIKVLETDFSDPKDMLVYGLFDYDGYVLRNTTLFSVTSASQSGVYHLSKDEEDGIHVEKAELPEAEKECKKLFKKVDGLYEELVKINDEQRKTLREEAIADYVSQNELAITQYQDFGWAPVAIKGAGKTKEKDQIYTFESPKGYQMTFDMRKYTLQSDDEQDMYDAVEDKNEGFLTVNKAKGESMDKAIIAAADENDVSNLSIEDGKAGKGISCRTAKHDEKLEDGRVFRYIWYGLKKDEDPDEQVYMITICKTFEKGEKKEKAEKTEEQFADIIGTFQ